MHIFPNLFPPLNLNDQENMYQIHIFLEYYEISTLIIIYVESLELYLNKD